MFEIALAFVGVILGWFGISTFMKNRQIKNLENREEARVEAATKQTQAVVKKAIELASRRLQDKVVIKKDRTDLEQ